MGHQYHSLFKGLFPRIILFTSRSLFYLFCVTLALSFTYPLYLLWLHLLSCQAQMILDSLSFYIIFLSCFIHFHYCKSSIKSIILHIFICRSDVSSGLQDQNSMYLVTSTWMYPMYIKLKISKNELLFPISPHLLTKSNPSVSFTILNESCLHSAT